MKNCLSKIWSFGVIFLLSFTFSAVNAQSVNFSGDWKLNESKSDLGEFGGFSATAIKVEQKASEIVIARTTPGFNGGDPRTTSLTLTYDGKPVEAEGFGGSKRISSAKWSADGKTLTVSSTMKFNRDGEEMEFKSTETWTLGADGLLTVATTTNSPMGDNTTKAVYNK